MLVPQSKLARLTPNLGILWIWVCSFWLCGSIVANPIIYRLVPSPSRYEIRQWMPSLMRNVLLQWLFTSGRPVHNFPRFQGAQRDHVRVQSSSCCFPRELVSFNPRHVTRSPPIRKRIWVGRCNNSNWWTVFLWLSTDHRLTYTIQ